MWIKRIEAEERGLQKQLFSYFKTRVRTIMVPESVGWDTRNVVKRNARTLQVDLKI